MTRRTHSGMTVLELMIVLAIIALGSLLVRSGFRMISKADLVENASELAAIMRRTSQLAIEHGEMHRVVFDLETQMYVVEVCQGATAIQRNEKLRADAEEVKNAKERGKDKMQNMPADSLQGADPEEATRRMTALAGKHIADRMCVPAQDTIAPQVTNYTDKKTEEQKRQETGWVRTLRVKKGIKFKEIWVQHRDESSTKGQVAVYFFPTGSSEKAVIEMTDGDETFSVLVYGLTGRVELKDGVLKDVNDHMMRNAMGDKDAKREDSQ
jgi:prepilin-type N-terminal cleavage/methylation domain-containing protein